MARFLAASASGSASIFNIVVVSFFARIVCLNGCRAFFLFLVDVFVPFVPRLMTAIVRFVCLSDSHCLGCRMSPPVILLNSVVTSIYLYEDLWPGSAATQC